MNGVFLPILISVILVSLISLIGVLTLSVNRKFLHNFLIYFVSFAAGALIGDAFLHLLPETLENAAIETLSVYIITGIIIFFAIEKFIHWRHCHHHGSAEINKHKHRPFAYINLIGDAVHNFIDGMIIAGSYLINVPLGIATTAAVIFHEIPQEIGDFAILIHGGFKVRKALLFNLLSASAAILGAVVAFLLSSYISGLNILLSGLTIGAFIYIANSDLIPELTKETDAKKSFFQLLSFLGGIFIMVLLL